MTAELHYWDTVGPAKSFSLPLDIARLSTWVSRNSRIIDIGCGYGRGIAALRAAGFRDLTGVDPSRAMIVEARARVPEARFEVMTDPRAIPVDNATMDAALVIGVLTAIPRDEDQRALAAEILRVLTPGGILAVIDFWIQDDERNCQRYEAGVSRHGVYGVFDLPEGVTLRHQSREWIRDLTSAFEPLATDDLTVKTMNGHDARGFQWYGRAPKE
jgi:ubiquinone/menaquinone biosynthesis C-methylase UbiE